MALLPVFLFALTASANRDLELEKSTAHVSVEVRSNHMTRERVYDALVHNQNRTVTPSAPDCRPLLKKHSEGDKVKQLQEVLLHLGFADVGSADGKFGPKTEDALRDFQEDEAIDVDGKYGCGTKEAMDDALDGDSVPEPVELPSEKYVRYKTKLANLGFDLDADLHEKGLEYAVIGVRGQTLQGRNHPTTFSPVYDDFFVVIKPDGSVQEFEGATHAGQKRSSASPDITGDGQGDVGILRAGRYRATPHRFYKGKQWSWLVRQWDSQDHNVPGWRDTNHNGKIDPSEKRDGITVNAILFHQGSHTRPLSIGCQTMTPSHMRDFIVSIEGTTSRKPRQTFVYYLLDENLPKSEW